MVNISKCPGLVDMILTLYKGGTTAWSAIKANPDIVRLSKGGQISDKQIKDVLVKAEIDPVDTQTASAASGKGIFIFIIV
jgi:hypothetical protein